jgi:hypothetical protein
VDVDFRIKVRNVDSEFFAFPCAMELVRFSRKSESPMFTGVLLPCLVAGRELQFVTRGRQASAGETAFFIGPQRTAKFCIRSDNQQAIVRRRAIRRPYVGEAVNGDRAGRWLGLHNKELLVCIHERNELFLKHIDSMREILVTPPRNRSQNGECDNKHSQNRCRQCALHDCVSSFSRSIPLGFRSGTARERRV